MLFLDPAVFKCWYNNGPNGCPALTLLRPSLHPTQVLLFSGLLALYALILWAIQAGRVPWPWQGWAILLQAGAVLGISLVLRQDNLVLSLYLALALEAIGLASTPRAATLVAGGALVLFVVSDLWSHGALNSWMDVLVRIWTGTDYAALSLFVAGYLFLYLQLSRAHAALATAHLDLEEANVELSISANRIASLTRIAERRQLARELHDTLTQGLVGLKLQLEAVDALLQEQRPHQAQVLVRQGIKRIQQALAQARATIADLRDEGTVAINETIGEFVERFALDGGIACHSDVVLPPALPALIQAQLMRIVSEALANIARHARARQVWISVHAQEAGKVGKAGKMGIELEIRDDGAGFDPTAPRPGHYGLSGIAERIRLLGGEFEIRSSPGAGTCLRCYLPLAEEGADAGEQTERRPV
jgi:NarL family two-component system sensor histidine kinase YdfH